MSHQHLNNVGLQIYTRGNQRSRNLLGSASMRIVTIDRWGPIGRAVGRTRKASVRHADGRTRLNSATSWRAFCCSPNVEVGEALGSDADV